MEMKTAISCTILRQTKILIAVGVRIISLATLRSKNHTTNITKIVTQSIGIIIKRLLGESVHLSLDCRRGPRSDVLLELDSHGIHAPQDVDVLAQRRHQSFRVEVSRTQLKYERPHLLCRCACHFPQTLELRLRFRR